MTEALPRFKYHPDPVRSGVLKESGATCRACGRARGWIYTGPVYSVETLRDEICPWCIADGSAAESFGATFTDGQPLAAAGLSDAIVHEVERRTPGYVTWQGEDWVAHCGDACECHGDLPKRELARLDETARRLLQDGLHVDDAEWAEFVRAYVPGGQPAIYLFVCRHCDARLLRFDFT